MPVLVGNEKQRHQLIRMLTDATQGKGTVSLITGGLSSGKTEVLHDLANRAEHDEFTVLRAMAAADEQDYPYALIEQLLDRAHVVGDVVTLLREHADGGTPTSSVPPGVLRSILHALIRLSNDAPVLIAIDDLHYADALSLKCLLYLIRRIRSTRIAVALTHGAQRCAARRSLLGELLYHSHTQQVSLSMLSDQGIADLLTQELGEPPAAWVASAYGRASGGNPSLVRALLQDQEHDEHSSPAREQPVPRGTYRETVLACIHHSGPAALRVARAIALLNGYSSIPLVAGLAEVEESEAREAIQVFDSSGILDGGSFRHSTMRIAVLNELTPDEGTRLHQRAARLLRDSGADPVTISRHLLAADDATEPWVATVLSEAADELLAEERINLAIRCLQLAERRREDPQLRITMRIRIIWLLWRIRPEASRSYATVVLSKAADNTTSDLPELWLISVALWYGWGDRAVRLAERNAQSWNVHDPRVRSEATAVGNWIRTSVPGLADRIVPLLPAETTEETGLAGALRTLRGVLTSRDGCADVAEQIVQQARRLDFRNLIPATYAILALVYAGRLESSAAWCDQIISGLKKRRAPSWLGVFAGLRAMIALRMGDLETARSDAEYALHRLSLKDGGELAGIPLATLIEAYTAAGDHKKVADIVRQPTPKELFQTRSCLHYLYARGRHHLSEGRHHASLGDFIACGEHMQVWGLDSPALVPWRSAAAEAYLRLGDQHRAEQLATEELTMIREGDSRGRAHTLRVVAATHPLEHRVATLHEALTELKGTRDGHCQATILADLGRALRQTREHDRARDVLRQAQAAAEECGAKELFEEVRRELDTLAPCPELLVPPGPEGTFHEKILELLTVAERRVAALAIQGYSNREISRRLFITVSTVEQHLTHTYKKFGIRRRDELPTNLSLDIAD